MNPFFSIIVPVYNTEQYLRQCLDSILAQTFEDWECILMDDGSTDESGKICDEYAATDSRFVVIHKQNGGVSSARNMGLQSARGKYVWFIDSDDWIFCQSLCYFFEKLIADDAEILFWGLVEIPSNIINENLSKIPSECCKDRKGCGEIISLLEQYGLFGFACNKIFKKEIIEQSGLLFDTRISIREDHIFTLEYVKYVKKIQVLHIYPYYYRQRESSLMRKKNQFDEMIAQNLTIYQKRRELIKVFDFEHEQYVRWFTTDYIIREVRNLRKMRREGFPVSRRIAEIDRVKRLILKEKNIRDGLSLKHRTISWIPSFILSYFL